MPNVDRIRQLSSELHSRYVSRYGGLDIPIDHVRLAQLVNARIETGATIPVRADVSAQGGGRIIRISSTVPSKEHRILVSHEIVHILLGEDRSWNHPGERQYLADERLINLGAGLLLVPPSLLQEFVSDDDAFSLEWFLRTAKQFGVTVAVLAKRVIREPQVPFPLGMLLCVFRDQAERDRRVLRVFEWIGSSSWFIPNNIKTEKLGLAVTGQVVSAPFGQRVACRDQFFVKIYDQRQAAEWKTVPVISEAIRLGTAEKERVIVVVRGHDSASRGPG